MFNYKGDPIVGSEKALEPKTGGTSWNLHDFDIKILCICGTPLGSDFLAPKRLRSLNGRKIIESIRFFVSKFYTFLAPLSDPNREEIHAML